MRAKILYVAVALAMTLSLVAVAVPMPVASPATTPAEALDGTTWHVYPSIDPSDTSGWVYQVPYKVHIEANASHLDMTFVALEIGSGEAYETKWNTVVGLGLAEGVNIYIDANNSDTLDADGTTDVCIWAMNDQYCEPLNPTQWDAGTTYSFSGAGGTVISSPGSVQVIVPYSLLGISSPTTIGVAFQVFGYAWYPADAEPGGDPGTEQPRNYLDLGLPVNLFFGTIQDAIDNASSGDTILVHPGTYNEDIYIDEDLTVMSSDGAEVTKIAGAGGAGGIVEIGSTCNVTLQGFDIDPGNLHGVAIDDIDPGYTVNILDCDIYDMPGHGINIGDVYGTLNIEGNEIHDNGSPGGDGIHINWVHVWSDIVNRDNGDELEWGQGEVNILDNEIYDNENDGIAIGTGQGVCGGLVTIDGNEIYDNDGDGIEIGYIGVHWVPPVVKEVMGTYVPGNVTITNNDISSNDGDGITVDYVGAAYPEGEPVRASLLIQGNYLFNNWGGFSNIHIDCVEGEVDIDDNVIAMMPMGGLGEVGTEDLHGLPFGIYIGNTIGDSPAGDVDITNNTIVHCWSGIFLGYDAREVEVYGNLIVNNHYGIKIWGDYNIIGAEGKGNIISRNWPSGYGIYLGSNAVGNEIHYNDIALNTLVWHWLTHPEFEPLNGGPSYGVYNANNVWVDATCNWWGDASGPLHLDLNPEGRGDLVSDRVYFDPWECSAGPYVDTTPPTIVDTAAAPDMVSLWPGIDWMMMSLEDFIPEGVMSEEAMGDFEAMSDDIEAAFNGIMLPYPTGPFLSFLIVEAADNNGVAMVTVDYASVLKQLLPEGKIAKIIEEVGEERWEMTMYLLERWPMFYDCHEQDVWFTPYFTPSIFIVLGCCLGLDMDFILEIMLQEIQLGRVDIPVTVYDYSGNTNTVSATIALDIVDVQRPLAEGWNIRSTWIQPGINKWSQILDLGNLQDTPGSILRWNPEFQRWEDYREGNGVGYWYNGTEQVELALMEVLDAYYINVEYFDQMGIVMSRDNTAPPSRDLYRGWNLISLAPDPIMCYDRGWVRVPFGFVMPVKAALVSIDVAPGDLTGWTIVLSPGQFIDYWEEWWYEDTYFGGWWKFFLQEPWGYTVSAPEYVMEFMSIGGGYWVQMEHDDLLAGFSYTPLFMMEWGGPMPSPTPGY